MRRHRVDGVRGGWTRLVLETLSRVYLAGMLTLVVIAVLPVLLGWQSHVIRTGSMEPRIAPGDVVLTSSLPSTSPVPVGRVVSFVIPATADASGHETIRMHRIVGALDGRTFVTAGDANVEADSTPLRREQITGQGRLVVPAVGLPSNWIAEGEPLKLAAWLALTAAAIVLAGLSIPRRSDQDDEAPPLPDRRRTLAPAHRGRGIIATSGAAVSVVAMLAPALMMAGSADAAFTARTKNAGNSFAVAVNASTASSTYQVYDTTSGGGWYQRPSVTVNLSATAKSGSIASITYRLNGGAAVVTRSTSVAFQVTTQGSNTLTYFATDNLGRAENTHTVQVKLDEIAPTLTVTSRTGDMTHAQWVAACSSQAPTGGLCGDSSDASSGVASVRYTLVRASDNACFTGSGWSATACSTSRAATLASTGRWFVPVPDALLSRSRAYYTINLVATDVAGSTTTTSRTFSVG